MKCFQWFWVFAHAGLMAAALAGLTQPAHAAHAEPYVPTAQERRTATVVSTATIDRTTARTTVSTTASTATISSTSGSTAARSKRQPRPIPPADSLVPRTQASWHLDGEQNAGGTTLPALLNALPKTPGFVVVPWNLSAAGLRAAREVYSVATEGDKDKDKNRNPPSAIVPSDDGSGGGNNTPVYRIEPVEIVEPRSPAVPIRPIFPDPLPPPPSPPTPPLPPPGGGGGGGNNGDQPDSASPHVRYAKSQGYCFCIDEYDEPINLTQDDWASMN